MLTSGYSEDCVCCHRNSYNEVCTCLSRTLDWMDKMLIKRYSCLLSGSRSPARQDRIFFVFNTSGFFQCWYSDWCLLPRTTDVIASRAGCPQQSRLQSCGFADLQFSWHSFKQISAWSRELHTCFAIGQCRFLEVWSPFPVGDSL